MPETTDIKLEDKDRLKLDGIVQQMQGNKESDDNINLVVEDFKSKYGKKEPSITSEEPLKKKESPYSPDVPNAPTGKQPLQGLGSLSVAPSVTSDPAIATQSFVSPSAYSTSTPKSYQKRGEEKGYHFDVLKEDVRKTFLKDPLYDNPKNRETYLNYLQKQGYETNDIRELKKMGEVISGEKGNINQLTEIVKKQPENKDAINNLGESYTRLGEPEKALKYFYDALQAPHPEYDVPVTSTIMGESDPLKAANEAKEKNASNDSKSLYGIGVALQHMGKNDEALNYYKDAIKTDPKNSDAYDMLSKISNAKGDKDSSKKFAAAAKQLKAEKPTEKSPEEDNYDKISHGVIEDAIHDASKFLVDYGQGVYDNVIGGSTMLAEGINELDPNMRHGEKVDVNKSVSKVLAGATKTAFGVLGVTEAPMFMAFNIGTDLAKEVLPEDVVKWATEPVTHAAELKLGRPLTETEKNYAGIVDVVAQVVYMGAVKLGFDSVRGKELKETSEKIKGNEPINRDQVKQAIETVNTATTEELQKAAQDVQKKEVGHVDKEMADLAKQKDVLVKTLNTLDPNDVKNQPAINALDSKIGKIGEKIAENTSKTDHHTEADKNTKLASIDEEIANLKASKESMPLESKKVIDEDIKAKEAEKEKLGEKPTIASPVIKIGENIYRGKDHGEAIEKAKEAGEDVSKVDRERDGLFETSDGRLLTRAESQKEFGVSSSEELRAKKGEEIPKLTEDENKELQTLMADKAEGLTTPEEEKGIDELVMKQEAKPEAKKEGEIKTKEDATKEIIKQESVQEQPKGGTEIRKVEETGVSDSVLGAEKGKEEVRAPKETSPPVVEKFTDEKGNEFTKDETGQAYKNDVPVPESIYKKQAKGKEIVKPKYKEPPGAEVKPVETKAGELPNTIEEAQTMYARKQITLPELQKNLDRIRAEMRPKAEVAKKKVKEAGDKLKKIVNPLGNDSTLKRAGVDTDKIIDKAVRLIHKGIDLHGDITKAINDAIEQIKTTDFYKKLTGDPEFKADEFDKSIRDAFEKTKGSEEKKVEKTEEDIKAILDKKTDKPIREQLGETIKDSKIVKTAESIVKAFHPFIGKGKEYARDAAIVIRKRKGEESRQLEIINKAQEKMLSFWNKVPKLQRLSFITSIENPEKYGIRPEYKELSDSYRKRLDTVFETISKIKDIPYIEDYFPHFWKDPGKAREYFGTALSKVPLEGSKSFLKQRFHDDILSGMKAGLELATDNPEEIVRLAEINSWKFKTAHDIFGDMKESGLIKYFENPKDVPEGYSLVRDPLFDKMFGKGYYMPEDAARIVDNYLSRGLIGRDGAVGNVANLIRNFNNILNQFQLGMGVFHATTTSIDATVSGMARGIRLISSAKPSNVLKGVEEVLKSTTFVPNIIETVSRGNKAINKLGKGVFDQDVKDLTTANAKSGLDKFYATDAYYNMRKGFDLLRTDKDFKKVPSVVWNAIKIIPEAFSKPIMDWYVPRLKVGGYLKSVETELALRKDLTPREIDIAKQKAWDDMDNRLGQMVYDNIFWNKTMKDIGFLSIRSMGWTGGTIRAIGGGIGEIPKSIKQAAKGEGITDRTAWLMSLPLLVGTYGALYQKMMTGKGPEELEDYFYPKDGTMNPDGTPHRVSLPSYLKDMYSYGRHLFKTAGHKVSPWITNFTEIVQNKDFYNTQLYNEDDPAYKKGLDILKYEAESFVPFSFRQQPGEQKSFIEQVSSKQGLEQKLGIMPAPREFDRTKTQNLIVEETSKSFLDKPRTSKEAERITAKRMVRELIFKGTQYKDIPDNMKKIARMTSTDITEAKLDPYKRMFSHVEAKQQLKIISEMSPKEREDYSDYIHKRKAFNDFLDKNPAFPSEHPEYKEAWDYIMSKSLKVKGSKLSMEIPEYKPSSEFKKKEYK